MKKIITAIENSKLLKKIKEEKNIQFLYNNLQYREAILEILEKNKNIDLILISENLPGEISIEDLLKKIKLINKKIEIIFFLEKENEEKENKLKKLKIKNIYYINKINNKKNNFKNKKIKIKLKERINKLKNKYLKKEKNKKPNNIIKNKKDNKTNQNLEKEIITIFGEQKSGKTTITNLLIIYLIEKNKKILLINLNNKIEKNYLILLGKKYYKNNKKNPEIKINKNLTFFLNFEKYIKNKKENIKNFFKKCIKNYDYILIDIGKNNDNFFKNEIIKNSNKKIIVGNENLLNLKEIKELIKNKKEREIIKKSEIKIIQNKYLIKSFSFLITKDILNKFATVYKMFNNKNYKNLAKEICKRENIKISKLTKNKIKKILK